MCATSVIGDDFMQPIIHGPTQAEFDALKKEIAELKKLLKAAKRFDKKTGQPDCEQEDKVALLRKLAELVGIDLSEVFPAPKAA